jgi:hypothetical protein
LPGTIQDQELLFDQDGFGDDRTRAARSCESGDGRKKMDEKYSQITHEGSIRRPQNARNTHKSAIRHGHLAAQVTCCSAFLLSRSPISARVALSLLFNRRTCSQ